MDGRMNGKSLALVQVELDESESLPRDRSAFDSWDTALRFLAALFFSAFLAALR